MSSRSASGHRLRRRFFLRPVPVAVAGVLVAGGVATVPILANGASAAACSVSYKVVAQWGDGFQGAVAVTNNRASKLGSWKLTFGFGAGQEVTQGWDGAWKQSGRKVTVTNSDWNGELAPGAAVSSGFLASWTGENAAPTSFRLNGRTCDVLGTVSPSASTDVTPTFSESTSPTPTASATPRTTATPTPTPTVKATTAAWNPPAGLVQPLDEVWKHEESTYSDLYGFRNYGWDQLIASHPGRRDHP